MRKLGAKLIFLLGLLLLLVGGQQAVQAATNNYQYTNDDAGNYLTNGTADSTNTYNYNYGAATNSDGAAFDDEGYVNYGDSAYLKKSVAENPAKQGLFDVSLAMKGNNHSYPVDVVLVMDFSSTMKGEKLQNAVAGVTTFLNEISDVLSTGNVRVGIVTYNRKVVSTNGFLTDPNQLTSFINNEGLAHTGTFTQAGLLAGQKMLDEDSKEQARKILVHIGDGSANQSYQPGTTTTPNNGTITDAGQFQASSYITEFKTNDIRYISSKDADTVPGSGVETGEVLGKDYLAIAGTDEITRYTLGTILALRQDTNLESYSVGVEPTARGEIIAKNIASTPANYREISADMSDLGPALDNIASQIDNTIPDGTVSDPMGHDIILQKQGAEFGPGDYTLTGERKNAAGEWEAAPNLLNTVKVSENAGVISVTGLQLGKDEKVVLTYHVRINTESADFKPDTWYLANGRTTLNPDANYDGTATPAELLDFPIPSIKAPGVKLAVNKEWRNEDGTSARPEAIDFVVKRSTNTDSSAWQASNTMQLTAANGWRREISSLTPAGSTQTVALPQYNNQGDDYSYTVAEVNVPNGYESSVNTNGNQITLVNKWTPEEVPDPGKPDEIDKPEEVDETDEPDEPDENSTVTKEEIKTVKKGQDKLPQANERRNQGAFVAGLILLGLLVIGGVVKFFKRSTNK